MIFFSKTFYDMYVKKIYKGIFENRPRGIGRYSLKDEFYFEFLQSVHSIILKVNLSAGLCFQNTVRRQGNFVIALNEWELSRGKGI